MQKQPEPRRLHRRPVLSEAREAATPKSIDTLDETAARERRSEEPQKGERGSGAQQGEGKCEQGHDEERALQGHAGSLKAEQNTTSLSGRNSQRHVKMGGRLSLAK